MCTRRATKRQRKTTLVAKPRQPELKLSAGPNSLIRHDSPLPKKCRLLGTTGAVGNGGAGVPGVCFWLTRSRE